MKLYGSGLSPNVRKPLAVINHLDLDVELIDVKLQAGEHKTPEYLALNPNGKIPCLVDGDFKLWESTAIMQYLADQKPGNSLYPADLQARADINRWMAWSGIHLNKTIGVFVYENMVKKLFGQGGPEQRKIDDVQADFNQFATVIWATAVPLSPAPRLPLLTSTLPRPIAIGRRAEFLSTATAISPPGTSVWPKCRPGPRPGPPCPGGNFGSSGAGQGGDPDGEEERPLELFIDRARQLRR